MTITPAQEAIATVIFNKAIEKGGENRGSAVSHQILEPIDQNQIIMHSYNNLYLNTST